MNKILKKKIEKCIKLEKSEFMETVRFAFIMGVGSILCGVTDLFWVIMDMIYMFHFHHVLVFIGLLGANILMVISFIYLYRSMMKHIEESMKPKVKRKYNRKVKNDSIIS